MFYPLKLCVCVLVSVCMSLTPPYVGVLRVSCAVRALRPAYVTAPTSCSLERRPLCVPDNQQTSQMTQTCCHLAASLWACPIKPSVCTHTHINKESYPPVVWQAFPYICENTKCRFVEARQPIKCWFLFPFFFLSYLLFSSLSQMFTC